MIVADKEGLSPKHYRKFNIRYDLKNKKISKIDDYYMMEEVLSRRLSKINKDENAPVPNVIIIDGGRVLNITASGYNLKEAINSAYKIIDMLDSSNLQYRKDIGAKGLLKNS